MTTVRMEIEASRALMFARILSEEGLEVMWEGPVESPVGVEDRIVPIVFYLKRYSDAGLAADAAYAAAQAAVEKIHERFPEAKIGEVEQDDPAC